MKSISHSFVGIEMVGVKEIKSMQSWIDIIIREVSVTERTEYLRQSQQWLEVVWGDGRRNQEDE